MRVWLASWPYGYYIVHMDNINKASQALPELIESRRKALEMSKQSLYAKTGFSRSTFDRKIANPDLFTLQELARISAVLDLELVKLKAA